MSVPRPNTCHDEGVIRLTNSSGYISGGPTSPASQEGWPDCPLLVEVEAHQRISLSLIDFSLPPGSNSWYHRASSAGSCNRIAVISERNSTRENTTVCGGRKREAEVYTSTANNIEIRINRNSKHFFLLKYEGRLNPPLDSQSITLISITPAMKRC